MLKSDSIFFKVTILFIFSLVSFIFFVIYFINSEINKNNRVIEQRYGNLTANLNNLISFDYNLSFTKSYLLDIGFFEILDDDIKSEFLNNYLPLQIKNKLVALRIRINMHYFIVIHDAINNNTFFYTDYEDIDYSNYYLIALLAVITLIFFYILVLNSLLPLRLLRREVKRFANGDMNIQLISSFNDEIGELSQEFAKAAYTINEINKARVLFLRSTMHELKTPITKGRIVTEMLSDVKAKNRLISVFTRLNSLIDDFAKIEEISTKNYKISKSKFSLIELLHNINKMLLIEEERPRNVLLLDRDSQMIADFDAMSLSVKNLIDNAIKHSSDNKVTIFVQGNDLVVQNQGKPFNDNFNNYFQPFYDDGKQNKEKGLGLGMYIIKHTIEFQSFKLEYKYDDGFHYFYIKNCIVVDD